MLQNNGDAKVLVVIPARGGSKRIPNKNIVPFRGQPMISYSIKAAKDFGYADEVMVSTDDEIIADVARGCGASVPFMRSKETSDDKTGIADVLLEVLREYEKRDWYFNVVICILATAPLIQIGKLKEAYEMFLRSDGCNGVCPVEAFSYPPQRGLVIKNNKIEMKYPQNYDATSQSLETIYHDCGQFFILRTDALKKEKRLYLTRMLPLVLDENESQDIDNYSDLKMAELKYEMLLEEGKL